MSDAIPYPSTLTDKEWQKSKGTLGKIVVGKTDVGASLTALQSAFAKSDFAKAAAPFDKTDPVAFKEFIKSAKTGLDKQASEISVKIAAATKAAATAAGDIKGNSKIPDKVGSSVSKALAGIISNLDAFDKIIAAAPAKVVADLTGDFRSKIKSDKFVAALKQSCGSVETKWKALLSDIKTVEADPKIATVDKVFSGDNNARGITTAAKFWDQIVSKQFPATAAKIYAGKAMSDYYALPCFPEIADQKGAATLKTLVEKSGQQEDRVVTAYMLKFSSSVVKSHELVNHMKSLLQACEGV